MKLVQLQRANDWGTVYLAEQPRDECGSTNWRRGVSLKAGDPIRVRWPNGNESDHVVVMQESHQDVSDHGNTSRVVSHIPSLIIDYNGVHLTVPLDAVLVWL